MRRFSFTWLSWRQIPAAIAELPDVSDTGSSSVVGVLADFRPSLPCSGSSEPRGPPTTTKADSVLGGRTRRSSPLWHDKLLDQWSPPTHLRANPASPCCASITPFASVSTRNPPSPRASNNTDAAASKLRRRNKSACPRSVCRSASAAGYKRAPRAAISSRTPSPVRNAACVVYPPTHSPAADPARASAEKFTCAVMSRSPGASSGRSRN